jgi:hypothetical protein
MTAMLATKSQASSTAYQPRNTQYQGRAGPSHSDSKAGLLPYQSRNASAGFSRQDSRYIPSPGDTRGNPREPYSQRSDNHRERYNQSHGSNQTHTYSSSPRN